MQKDADGRGHSGSLLASADRVGKKNPPITCTGCPDTFCRDVFTLHVGRSESDGSGEPAGNAAVRARRLLSAPRRRVGPGSSRARVTRTRVCNVNPPVTFFSLTLLSATTRRVRFGVWEPPGPDPRAKPIASRPCSDGRRRSRGITVHRLHRLPRRDKR